MSKALTKIDQFQIDLSQNRKAIQSVLPPHVDLQKFQRIAFTAVQKSPNLAGQPGLLDSVLDCARDGLLPDGREASLVPFKGKVAYMPMVGGILKKIRQSGELSSISANVVYENDKFDYFVDENGPHFNHRPELMGDRGKIKGAYAVAITKDDGKYFEFLTLDDIQKIRNSSASGNGGPWKTWPDEMAKKSAVRRLAKRLPMSTDVEGTFTHDNQFYDMEHPEPVKSEKGVSGEELGETLKKKPPVNKQKEAESQETKTADETPAIKKGAKSELDIF